MDDLEVRLARKSDREKILKLFDTVFNEQQRSVASNRSEKFWNWKYEDNVFGKAVVQVIEFNSEIIAAGSMWPWYFKSDKKMIKAFQLCDSVVASEYRGKGLFYKLNDARVSYAKELGFDFIFNFPNSNSLPVHLKMGRIFLGKLQWYIKVLKPQKIFKYLANSEKSEKLKIPFEYQIKNYNKLYKKKIKDSKKIKVDRIKGYYEWRYGAHSSREYGIVEVENNENYAFAIFTLSKMGETIEMIIVDSDGDKMLRSKLLKKIIKAARKLSVSLLFVVLNDMIIKKDLFLNAFIPKKNKNLVCFPLNENIKKNLLDIKNWDLFAGLHDSI